MAAWWSASLRRSTSDRSPLWTRPMSLSSTQNTATGTAWSKSGTAPPRLNIQKYPEGVETDDQGHRLEAVPPKDVQVFRGDLVCQRVPLWRNAGLAGQGPHRSPGLPLQRVPLQCGHRPQHKDHPNDSDSRFDGSQSEPWLRTGKPHLSHSTIKMMYPVVEEVVDEQCLKLKEEMKEKPKEEVGSWKQAITSSDGVWLTRRFFSQIFTFTVWNYLTGGMLYLHAPLHEGHR